MMYTRHFSLSDTPFMEQPPHKHLFVGPGTDEYLARLHHFIQNGRISLLTGPTGVGKSSLLRIFAEEIKELRITRVSISASRLGATALLRSIVRELGEHPGRGRDRLFAQLDEKARGTDVGVLLQIDDAHLVDSAALIDLRLLSDYALDNGEPCFRILLSGQEELSRVLRQDRFADLRDRIGVRVRISPFRDCQQTALYIERQIKGVDGSPKIFTTEAIARIHAYSGGVMRRINNAATACLLMGDSRRKKIIDEQCCIQALQEVC